MSSATVTNAVAPLWARIFAGGRLRAVVPFGAVVVFAVAAVVRLGVIERHGGLRGDFGYDPGVYFGSADALIHGRMPYTDFVLLHPPALMVALTPFALLTKFMSDESAFTVANLGFVALGAVNAVLVRRAGRALGMSNRAATWAGLFYAVWFGAIGAEYLIKLEPLGNLLFLLGILALVRAHKSRQSHSIRGYLLAGLPFGVLVSVKIWWIVPVVVVLARQQLRHRDRRSTGLLAAGAVASALAVNLPFFVANPRAMWTAVITDQVTRGALASAPTSRLGDLSTVPRLVSGLSNQRLELLSVMVLAAIAWLAVLAWRFAAAQLFVVILVCQLALVLLEPSWFPYYSDFLAVPLALVIGAAATQRLHPRLRVSLSAVVVMAMSVVTTATLAKGTYAVAQFRDRAALTRSVHNVRCVISDEPMMQIEVDALSRGLAAGCRNWIDVTGRTYGPDRSKAPRRENLRWQHDLIDYLRSGGAVILGRAGTTGLSQRTWQLLRRDGELAAGGGHTVYRVTHSR